MKSAGALEGTSPACWCFSQETTVNFEIGISWAPSTTHGLRVADRPSHISECGPLKSLGYNGSVKMGFSFPTVIICNYIAGIHV